MQKANKLVSSRNNENFFRRRQSHDPTSNMQAKSCLSPAQQIHLDSEHFSRWAGHESRATGISPNPTFLQQKRNSLQQARSSIASQQQARRQISVQPTFTTLSRDRGATHVRVDSRSPTTAKPMTAGHNNMRQKYFSKKTSFNYNSTSNRCSPTTIKEIDDCPG